ncbi:unnamed protein product [Calypogeia fissa]
MKRLCPGFVLFEDLKKNQELFRDAINDIQGGFKNKDSIDQIHIREKIVHFFVDKRYRMKKKVRENIDSKGEYLRPLGMPQDAFERIVGDLNAGPDMPLSKRVNRAAVANAALVSRGRRLTNYWGQGGYKGFLGKYQRKFGARKVPSSPERIFAKRYGPSQLWARMAQYASDEEIDWTPPEGVPQNPISEDEKDEQVDEELGLRQEAQAATACMASTPEDLTSAASEHVQRALFDDSQ